MNSTSDVHSQLFYGIQIWAIAQISSPEWIAIDLPMCSSSENVDSTHSMRCGYAFITAIINAGPDVCQ